MFCTRRQLLCKVVPGATLAALVLTAAPVQAAGLNLVADFKGTALASKASGKARFRTVNGRQIFQVDGAGLTGFKNKYVVFQIVRGRTSVNLGRTEVEADGSFELTMRASMNTLKVGDSVRIIFNGQVLATGTLNAALN